MTGNSPLSALKRCKEPWGRGFFPSVFSGMFGAAVAARNLAYDSSRRFSVATGRPTISIGGLSAGGTGKTPMTLIVGKYVYQRGYEVVFLSRGFGRKTKETVISAPMISDSWEAVGDEPAMLHAALPQSWLGVDGDRLRAVSKVSPHLSSKAVFVLDDAFQHRRLKRDLDIVCMPADPFCDTLLPSGTLREPLSGLSRAQCICLIGAGEETDVLDASREKIAQKFPHTAIFILYQTPVGWVNAASGEFQTQLPLKRPVAVCGIARPQRFMFLLKKMSICTSAQSIFCDHHEFKEEDIARVAAQPGAEGIVTTEKDAFRLKSLKLVSMPDIWYLKMDLQFSDNDAERHFYQILDRTIE
jgi:tetraacyldisaccharide 4'-kinase